MIYALVQETHFREMIEQTTQREGQKCLVLDGEETLEAALQEETPKVLLMDICISSLDGPSFVEKFKQNPSTRDVPLVVFGGSVRADLLEDARELGADQVLPKSAFREQLAEIIRRYSKR